MDAAGVIQAYILANITNVWAISGPRVWAALGMTRKQADRLCHKQVGMSAVNYARKVHSGYAYDLLIGTNLKMYDIAAGVGYECTNTASMTTSLNRMFHSRVGCKPSDIPRFIFLPSYMRK